MAPNTVMVEMRRDLARELAEVLELEVREADEFQSTEQTMQEGAEAIRREL